MEKRLVLTCLMAIAVGCSGSTPATDSGVTPGNDTGPMVDTGPGPMVDTGPAAPAVLGCVHSDMTPCTVDLSCLGTATIPAGGAATTATIEVSEYVSMAAVADTTIELYTNDMPTGTCASPSCVMGMTDSMGHVDLSAPAGAWVGVHILPSAGTAEVIAYNQDWPMAAGTTFETAAFSASSISLVSSLLGRTFQTATAGAISGQVNDCTGTHIANAEARVFHGATQVVTGPASDRTSPRINGLQGTNPTRSTLTGDGGTFVGANVPVGDDYHVEIWGTRTAGGTPELIGCEEGRVVAGAITVLVTGPLRSDYAAGSPCDRAATAAGH